MTFKSAVLHEWFVELDDTVAHMEYEIDKLRKVVKELEDEKYKKEKQEANEAMNGMVNIISAALGTPNLKNLGPAAVIVLDKIRKMQTIEEVHQYIEERFDEARETIE